MRHSKSLRSARESVLQHDGEMRGFERKLLDGADRERQFPVFTKMQTTFMQDLASLGVAPTQPETSSDQP